MSKSQMYYKTERSSETGLKFKKVEDFIVKCFHEAEKIKDEYGFYQWSDLNHVAYGGISLCFFKEDVIPDKKVWKLVRNGGFMPKLNCNKGKEIMKKIQNLPFLSVEELNSCIGFTTDPRKYPNRVIGVSSGSDQYYGFSVFREWGITVPKDCVEITATEYYSLTDE